MINDNSKPLILIGSNSALWVIKEMCDQHRVDIHGIIDSNYFGNTDVMDGIPVIDTELTLENDVARLAYYKQNFNFFLATNYVPDRTDVQRANTQKRNRLRELIDRLDLPCVSFIDPSARVHVSNRIGKNVVIDALCYISAHNAIGDYCSFFAGTMIGYHNTIGTGTVFQRRSGTMHYNTFGKDVYVGLHSQISADNLFIADHTVIHPCMSIRRSTAEAEVISLANRDLRKVYYFYTMEQSGPDD